MPAEAVSLLVSLDGVMMCMNSETADGTATDVGWHAPRNSVCKLDSPENRAVWERYRSQ